MGSKPYGAQCSAAYALFGVVLCFATHGWYCTFVAQERQLQSYNPKGTAKDAAQLSYAERPQPRAGAVRSMATFATSLVYTVVPFAPATTSWAAFAAWTCALAVYWDLHFFCVHAFAHENRHAYKFLHKLHHMYKQPDVSSAYFVTYQVRAPRSDRHPTATHIRPATPPPSPAVLLLAHIVPPRHAHTLAAHMDYTWMVRRAQSHFCLEHSVILIAAAAGLPVDVFTWTLWFGTLDSFIKHGGHSISSCRLPFLPFSWEFLATCLSPWSLVFGGATTAEHDWHHEKFTTNYALSFTVRCARAPAELERQPRVQKRRLRLGACGATPPPSVRTHHLSPARRSQYLDKLLGKYHPGRKAGEAVKERSAEPEEDRAVAKEAARSPRVQAMRHSVTYASASAAA